MQHLFWDNFFPQMQHLFWDEGSIIELLHIPTHLFLFNPMVHIDSLKVYHIIILLLVSTEDTITCSFDSSSSYLH